MRKCNDWLSTYMEYADSLGEAESHINFWCGVSAIASVLQRNVWMDQIKYVWYPNFYIILVAPPAIIAKSTTANLALNLCNSIDSVTFGPESVSWQRLVQKFGECSAMTINAEEWGTLMRTMDEDMLNALIKMYDCRQFSYSTIQRGDEKAGEVCLNMIGCTTPDFIARAVPYSMIGGGLMSRILWVYSDHKVRHIAYPKWQGDTPEEWASNLSRQRAIKETLIHDLMDMSCLSGEFTMDTDAIRWGKDWYPRHFEEDAIRLGDNDFNGYIQRKQGHIHKLAMVMAISRGKDLNITLPLLKEAVARTVELERWMPMVFKQVGKSPLANQSDRLVDYVRMREFVTVNDAYEYVRSAFPKYSEFEAVLKGLIHNGILIPAVTGAGAVLKAGRQQASEDGSSTHSQKSPK